MPTSAVITLMKEFAILRNDIEWIKKGIYLCVSTSMVALLAVIGEIVTKLVVK